MSNSEISNGALVKGGVTVVLGLGLVVGMGFGGVAGCKSFNRYQAVQDAENKTRTSQIKTKNEAELARLTIATQEQRVRIAEQQAEIRLKEAEGLRKAQDEIAKSLTPLYVQLEMTKQIGEIAKSGENSSVIYIPVGPDGLPVVANTPPKADDKK